MLQVQNKLHQIELICKNHNVEQLYLFGSATNSSFSAESDIDFLVTFKQFDLKKYFNNYIALKEKLKSLFNREIDLVKTQTLKNPILIQSINNSKELVYG